MRVLVCGGRGFNDVALLRTALNELHAQYGFKVLIHGMQIGADLLAGQWAEDNGIKVEPYRAEWTKYGKPAGPIRNARMLTEGKPKLVIAFPGGRGTRDMCEKAIAAGVEVINVRDGKSRSTEAAGAGNHPPDGAS
jgi:hypothetical protein